MSIAKRLFIFQVICYVFVINTYAQTRISGQVTDNNGEAIMSASVLLYADSLLAPPMLAYAVTQNNGSFLLVADTVKTGWLQVRCIGYADSVLKAGGQQDNIKIRLKPNKGLLDEIIVKGTYSGIKVSGDTIKFDTGHFGNGFEDNVGELLDKLPGVSVSEDGTVSYGGKTVSKLLVDGKDLFSKDNNGIIIKNMSADIVDGAEIIHNYQGNDISDKFSSVRKTALNIKTKGIGNVTGQVYANAGYKEKYSAKSFTLGMNDRFAITSILSGNNLGIPVFSMNDYINRIIESGDLISGGRRTVNVSGAEAGLFYRPDNVYKDNGTVVSVDTKYNPSENFTMNGNVVYNNSSVSGMTTREETYLSENTVINNVSENEKRMNLILANFNTKWKPKNNISMASEFKAGGTWMRDFTQMQGYNIDGADYRQHCKFNNFKINGRLSLDIAYEKSMLYANAVIAYARKDNMSCLVTNKEILPVIYDTADGELKYKLDDEKQQWDDSFSAEMGYIHNLSTSFNISTSLNYLHDRQKLAFLPTYISSKNENLDLHEYYANIFLNKTKGRLKFKFGGTFMCEQNRLDNSFHNNVFKIYPVAELEYTFSATKSLSFSISRNNERIDMDKLSDIYIAESYNQIVAGSKIETPYRAATKLQLNYYDYNIERQTYFNIFANMERCNNDAIPHIIQEGMISIASYANDGTSDNAYLMTAIEKRFTAIPITLKGNLSFNYIKSGSFLNDATITTYVKSLNSNIRMASNSRSLFNGELVFKYSHSWNDLNGLGVKNAMENIGMAGKILLNHGNWKGNVALGYQHISGDTYRCGVFNLAFGVEYKMKEVRLKVSAENLLNINRTDWFRTINTPYYYTVEKYSRMPGYIIAGVVWNY